MREVSDFIVVLPRRMAGAGQGELEALRHKLELAFPNYHFQLSRERFFQDETEYTVLPIMGAVGDGDGFDDPDKVYMCKPLEPHVIPEIQAALSQAVTLN